MSDEERVESDQETESEGDTQAQETSQAEVVAKLDTLSRQLEASQAALRDPDYLEYQRSKLEKATEEVAEVQPTQSEEPDWDMMTQADLMRYTREERDKGITERGSAIDKRFKALDDKYNAAEAKMQLELAYIRHPDFREGVMNDESYREKLYGLIQQNPSWNAEALYKQMSMVQSHEAGQKQEAEKERANRELLAKTERAGLPGSTVTREDLSAEEAFAIAWAQKGAEIDEEA